MCIRDSLLFFFFKQKTAYEISACLVGSEMCIRDRVSITKACAVAGLGGKVYRSGDYDYYINETIRNNDPKAVGPFILASLEWERLQDVKVIVNRK